jgi:hypothetical protein
MTKPFTSVRALTLSKLLTLVVGLPTSAWALHGGAPVRSGEHSQVLRMVFLRDGERKICSGTRVGPRHVLTAAHCFGDIKRLTGWQCLPLGLNIEFANSRQPMVDGRGLPSGTPLAVEGVHIHPDVANTGTQFDSQPFERRLDLAIVELARDLPANFPTGSVHYGAVANGTAALMGGWGLLGHGREARNTLQLQLANTRVHGTGAKKFHVGTDALYLVHGDSGGPVLRASDGAVLGVNSSAKPSAWATIPQGTRDVTVVTGYDSMATPMAGMGSWVSGVVRGNPRPECIPTGGRR